MSEKLQIKVPSKLLPLFSTEKRYAFIWGGRGSGKSYAACIYLIVRAMAKKCRILVAREVQLSIASSSKQLIVDQITAMGLAEQFTVTESKIICNHNGSDFIFRGLHSSNVDGIKSLEGVDICFVDESQSISSKSLDILVPTIRKKDSMIIFCWNPQNEGDAIETFCDRANTHLSNALYININYYHNEFCSQELVDQASLDHLRDRDKYRHVWLGQFEKNSKQQIFTNWTIQENVKDLIPANSSEHNGCDFGFSSDPQAVVQVHISGMTMFIAKAYFSKHTEIDMIHVDLEKLYATSPIYADSSRPELISYTRREGFPMIKSKKGPGSIKAGIDFIKSFDIIIDSELTELIEEFSQYKYKLDRHTNQILPVPIDKYNHGIDAIRYALEPVRDTMNIIKPKLIRIPSLAERTVY